jgi:hypothetical protein
MSNRPYFIVRMQLDPAYEEEFNQWYNNDYLATLKPIAPLFTHCQRQVSGEGEDRVYLTIYEIKDEASIDEALAVFDREDRQEHRHQWKEWEKKAVKDIDARVFRSHYSW